MKWYLLAIYDNDSYLLKVGEADRNEYALCDKCNMILDKRTLIESNLPSYKIRRKKYHISCSYDGFIVVSQDFKNLYESSDWQGLFFYPIQRSKGFYLTECTEVVEINKTERPIEYNHKCSECNAYVGVYGSIPPYIDLSVLDNMKPNVFYRSDIEFGYDFEKSYSLFISEEIAKSLITKGLITYKDLTEVIAVQ